MYYYEINMYYYAKLSFFPFKGLKNNYIIFFLQLSN